MPRALKLCACLGCSGCQADRRCTTRVASGRCDPCARVADLARGTRAERGYGADHDAERRRWKPIVARGVVRCARCQELIDPTAPWALDHNDDRTGYLGPSHRLCNLVAAGKARHRR